MLKKRMMELVLLACLVAAFVASAFAAAKPQTDCYYNPSQGQCNVGGCCTLFVCLNNEGVGCADCTVPPCKYCYCVE